MTDDADDAWPPGTPWWVRRRALIVVFGACALLCGGLALSREWLGWQAERTMAADTDEAVRRLAACGCVRATEAP